MTKTQQHPAKKTPRNPFESLIASSIIAALFGVGFALTLVSPLFSSFFKGAASGASLALFGLGGFIWGVRYRASVNQRDDGPTWLPSESSVQ